jgi:hypothetical protein
VTRVNDDTTSSAERRSLSVRARDGMERVFMTTLQKQGGGQQLGAR